MAAHELLAERQKALDALASGHMIHAAGGGRCHLRTKSALVDPSGIDGTRMAISSVITVEEEDREGDVVSVEGLALHHHKANPVVMCNHGLGAIDLPVARAESPEGEYTVRPEKGLARAVSWFTNKVRESEQVFALVSERLLNGISIGFNVIEAERRHSSTGGHGLLVTRSELFEFSHCPVGVNAYALVDGLVGKSFCGSPLSPAILKSLAPLLPPLKEMVKGGFEEGRRLKEHQADPPFPGAAFDEGRHRWVKDGEQSGAGKEGGEADNGGGQAHFKNPPKDHAEALARVRTLPDMKKWASDPNAGMGTITDDFQGALNKHFGADGPPRVGTDDDVSAAVKAGGTEAFRGLTDAKFCDDFRSGAFFSGKGIYGNGTYLFTANKGADDEALPGGKPAGLNGKNNVDAPYGSRAYAAGSAARYAAGSALASLAEQEAGRAPESSKGAAMRMAISPDARVGTYEDVAAGQKRMLADIDARIGAIKSWHFGLLSNKADADECRELAGMRRLLEGDRGTGRYALMMGLDAYTYGDISQTVLLNRTKVIVSGKNFHGAGAKSLARRVRRKAGGAAAGPPPMAPEDSRRAGLVLSCSPRFRYAELADADMESEGAYAGWAAKRDEALAVQEGLSAAVKAAGGIGALPDDQAALFAEAEAALEAAPPPAPGNAAHDGSDGGDTTAEKSMSEATKTADATKTPPAPANPAQAATKAVKAGGMTETTGADGGNAVAPEYVPLPDKEKAEHDDDALDGMLPGARALAHVHGQLAAAGEAVEHHYGSQENPNVTAALDHLAEVIEAAMGHADDTFKSEYPDLDPPGGGAEKVKGDGDENDHEEREREEEDEGHEVIKSHSPRLTRAGKALAKSLGKARVAAGKASLKRMSKTHAGVINKAVECMEEVSGHEGELKSSHKTALAHHARCLKEMAADPDAGAAEGEELKSLRAENAALKAKVANVVKNHGVLAAAVKKGMRGR